MLMRPSASISNNSNARLFMGLGLGAPAAASSLSTISPDAAHLAAIQDSVKAQEAAERRHGLVLWRRTYSGADAARLLSDTKEAVDSLVAAQRDAGEFQTFKTVKVSGKAYQRLRTDVRQYVVTVWSCLFFLGMVGIATAFVVLDDGAISDKDTAMALVFAYAALGWLLSNGMLLSPRYRADFAIAATAGTMMERPKQV